MAMNDIILFQPLDKLPYFGNSMEPIAIQLLASAVEEKGFNATVLPTNATKEEFLSTVEKIKPFAIGFSIHSYVYKTAIDLAKSAKENSKKLGYNLFTIFGGYHPTALPKEVIKEKNVDFVVKGEGEHTLCELLAALKNQSPLEEVKGIVFKKNGKVIETPMRQRIKNLDSLPIAKRYQQYVQITQSSSIIYPPSKDQQSVARVPYGRGCPFGCSFCQAQNMLGREVYWRSPRKVLDEIEWLIEEYDTSYVVFLDLTFNANKKKVIELCNEFIRRDLPLYWSVNVRADLLDEEQLITMQKAKCSKISVGVECPFSDYAQKIKDHYIVNEKHLFNILNFADRLGILIRIYMIIGLLHETKEMIRSYPAAWRKLAFDEMIIAYATPLPATDFFDECMNKNLIPQPIPWQDFHMETPTIDTPFIKKTELMALFKALYVKTYFHENYINHVKNKIKKFPFLADSWINHFRFIKKVGLATGAEKEYNLFMQCLKEFDADIQESDFIS